MARYNAIEELSYLYQYSLNTFHTYQPYCDALAMGIDALNGSCYCDEVSKQNAIQELRSMQKYCKETFIKWKKMYYALEDAIKALS